MKRWTKQATRVAAVLTAGALVAGCGAGGRSEDDKGGGAAEVGITDDSVTVGATFPLTGVAAPGYSEIPTGTQAYFDYVNAQGGVNGRKIKYLVRDDGYNPTTTSEVTNELVLKDEVFAMLGALGTPTHSAVVDFLNSQKVPDLFVSSGSIQWGDDVEAKPYTFGWQPDYEIEGKIIGQWISENMPDAKVGLFLQDDDLGEDSEKGVRRYIDDQIVEVQRYTSGNTDVAPQITALKASGADLVLGFNVPSYTALSQLVALKLNYKPKWFYANIGSDPTLVGSLLSKFSEGAVDQAKPLDGVMTTQYIPGVDATDNPWVQLWQKVWDEQGKDGELTNYRIYGMSEAYAFVQALKAAGEDPTRESIVEAVEGMGDAEGPNLAPFRYSADSHLGISGMEVVEIKDGKTEPLTPILVTDIGDAPIEQDDSAADDAPPSSGIPE
ncbi:MAG TPA: ABC transporter substrate-binding protein [Marmoricola sp.]|nr:ABC transporter substrate-binding protein [Marmoricola sp.]